MRVVLLSNTQDVIGFFCNDRFRYAKDSFAKLLIYMLEDFILYALICTSIVLCWLNVVNRHFCVSIILLRERERVHPAPTLFATILYLFFAFLQLAYFFITRTGLNRVALTFWLIGGKFCGFIKEFTASSQIHTLAVGGTFNDLIHTQADREMIGSWSFFTSYIPTYTSYHVQQSMCIGSIGTYWHNVMGTPGQARYHGKCP